MVSTIKNKNVCTEIFPTSRWLMISNLNDQEETQRPPCAVWYHMPCKKRETLRATSLHPFCTLLIKRTSHERPVGFLQLALEELVHGKGHSLAGSNTHHTRGDTLVESLSTLLLEHVLRNNQDTGNGGLARLSTGLLEAGLDGIDGGVGEGTDGTGDETDECGLVRRQLGVGVFRLQLLQLGLELSVRGEVGGLVGTLAQGCEGDTTVQGAETLLLDHGEEGVGGAAVLGGVEGIGKTVMLGLQANLDHLHGVDNGDGLGDTGAETS